MEVVRFCFACLRLFHFFEEILIDGLGLGQAGVGVVQLIGGFVDGALEVGVFLAKAGEDGLHLGELLGLFRRWDGGESLLELGFHEDNYVVARLDVALEDGDLAAGGGGVKDGRFGRGRCRFRSRVAEGLEFLIDVLDAETDDTGVPVWVAGL